MPRSSRSTYERMQQILFFFHVFWRDINEPTNANIIFERTSTMSSGTKNVFAPIFLATEIMYCAFCTHCSRVSPGCTSLDDTLPGLKEASKSIKTWPVESTGSLKLTILCCIDDGDDEDGRMATRSFTHFTMSSSFTSFPPNRSVRSMFKK